MSNPSIMLDHPAWVSTEDGRPSRACRWGDATKLISYTGDTMAVDVADQPIFDVIDPAELSGSGELTDALRAEGPVARLRNPDLWEALATSVIRQVIRASQARKLYRAFCEAYGEQVGPALLLPTPETVLALTDDEFADLGMKFFRRALRAAAEAYLKHGDEWTALPAERLVTELQTVPRIGPWSAGATVADFTNDFTLYPYSDLAVRTWAARLAPSLNWPDDERDFAKMWRALAGDELSQLTLLTLAWGARHANGVAT
ncbi:hypothetical protein [Actinokineospora sp. HUAS TT18]|uniref:hypothetical protein n=1 Tax=Actinokineospora sp. HUAS TT18 TaxID=3447451 RepID=UPI003F5220F1